MSSSKKKTTVIIIRHGNTFLPQEAPRRVGGRTDLDLVPSGIEQAKKLGKYFKEHDILPQNFYSAGLKRTLQTSQHILDSMEVSLPIHVNTLFNEIDYGIDENQPENKVVERIGEDALTLWETKGIPPQGWNVDPKAILSSWKSFLEQCLDTHSEQTTFIVTSNGIARFAPLLLEIETKKLATGSFGELFFDGEWHLLQWNTRPN